MQEHAVLVVNEVTHAIRKSGSNIPNLKVCTTNELSVYDVLRADKLVFDEASMAKINETFSA
jgi:ribosomal protein L4